MPLTLTPVTPNTGGSAICSTTEYVSELRLCGAIGVSVDGITAGTLSLSSVSVGSLTLTPVVAN